MPKAGGPPEPDYAGMTVNERLYIAGLLESFAAAVRAGDRDAMINLLVMVQIEPKGATLTTDKILSHPTRYGRVNPSS
jgi:hypothetical protein